MSNPEKITINYVTMWAWELEDGSLCYWAEPSKENLFMGKSPSNAANPVKIVAMKYSDFKKINNKNLILKKES